MAEILIQAGADVNAMKDDGHTPLLMALRQVSVRFMRTLVNGGKLLL